LLDLRLTSIRLFLLRANFYSLDRGFAFAIFARDCARLYSLHVKPREPNVTSKLVHLKASNGQFGRHRPSMFGNGGVRSFLSDGEVFKRSSHVGYERVSAQMLGNFPETPNDSHH
jgi:hypothetical protein